MSNEAGIEVTTSIVREKTFEVIKSAVNKMVDHIRLTFGPAGSKVIISKVLYSMAVDDGVQIARDFELDDPSENTIVKLVREAAIRTNDRVGDGTTNSLIILQSIINEVARKSRFDGRKIELELIRALVEVKEQLAKMARQIKSKEELKKVALISYDDEKIAEMVADTYFKLGKDAVITIDKSSTMDTYIEMIEGIKIDHGYISPYMIINPDRMESTLEKPYILITDYRITEANDILQIMEKMAKENKRELVIICDNLEQGALATAIVNKLQGKFLIIAIVAPKGDDRKVAMEDIALMTGAKMFSEAKGDKLELAEITDLGRAERFICRQEESIIVGPKGKKSEINKVVTSLKFAIENEPKDGKKKDLIKRLGAFMNKLAVIKVGSLTENAQKTLRYKVEDCVNAIKAAFRGGVVCGAGLALAQIKTSSAIMNEALKSPSKQLMENMGLIENLGLDKDHVMNVVTGKVGPYMAVGVADPVDVLIAGVESAVSIASILLTSCGMIVEAPKKPSLFKED